MNKRLITNSLVLITNSLVAFTLVAMTQVQAETRYPKSSYYSAPSATNNQFSRQSNQYNQPGIITVGVAHTGTTVILGGTVVPYREISLTAQIPGRIEYLGGTEGDWFEEGDLLVAIDDDELLAKRQQVMADIESQSSALNNAQMQYSRELWSPQSRDPNRMPGMGMPSMFDQLFTRNMGQTMGYGNPTLERQADLYSSGSRMEQARSRQRGAVSRLKEIDAKLRDSRSVAPFNGVIVEKVVELGATVQPGQPLLKYADIRDLQIQAEVPARLMRGLRMNMVVPAMLDVGNAPVDARVAQIFPMADTQRHTVTVKFDLPKEVAGGPGMYAEVMIPDADAPVQELPVIPSSAIVWRGSLPAVFVHNQQNNRPELRLVRLGERVDGSSMTVLSGLRAGEQIYTSPPVGMSSNWSPQTQTEQK